MKRLAVIVIVMLAGCQLHHPRPTWPPPTTEPTTETSVFVCAPDPVPECFEP